MSNNFKNILLALVLISLCFMIKCKLDSNKEHVSEDVVTESSSQQASSQTSSSAKKEHITASNTDAVSSKESDSTIKLTENHNTQEPKTTVKKIKEQPKKVVKKATAVKKEKPTPAKKPKKKAPTPKAKIEFESMTWDFGEITEGDIIKKKFKFTNIGNAPLQIIGADASCGCARPTVPFLDIAPGESNEIGITYNSVNKNGDQKPEIIIESNTYPKHTVLKLSGTVKPKPKKEEKKIDSTEVKQDTTIKD